MLFHASPDCFAGNMVIVISGHLCITKSRGSLQCLCSPINKRQVGSHQRQVAFFLHALVSIFCMVNFTGIGETVKVLIEKVG